MLKIAYLLPALIDCGNTKIPFWLSKYLANKMEIEVFYFQEKTFSQRGDNILKFDVPVKRIDFLKFHPDLNKFDIIHSHALIPDLYVSLYSLKINAIKMTTIHGYHINDLKYEKNFLFSYLIGNLWDISCRQFDLAVCLTRSMEKFYKKRGLNKTITIYNGVQKPTVEKKIPPSSLYSKDVNYIHLSTVSSLNQRKGVEQILKLLQKDKRFFLTAIGGSYSEINRLQKLSIQLEVESRCIFLDFSDNPWQCVVNSDIFIFPSRSEGFGLVLAEAAFLEIPIICSDISTFREMFSEEEVSFFHLDDINDLYQKTLDFEVLKQKALKAKQKATQIFDIAQMCESYYHTYQSFHNI